MKPFVTPNPQDFKLRIVWSIDSVTKMVAEFSNCKWLPRIGETLVLPIDETRKPDSWRKFKVFDVVYDFQNQTVRVLCRPIKCSTSPDVKSLISKIEEPLDRWETWEKVFAASEAMMRANGLERQAQLEYELSQVDEGDVDEELTRLKREVLE
ncbi:hypothetical protein FD724_06555 [Nostoc sp. C057]|uniref:hypothetical protein n=1 Tax=Nostoc sp. C057 TaxID=2576903 RepID=UPI0015C403AC|nr:hypothetical protein [Nostoc sp. C057]QLE47800.1 hypothetical protein FD724_06555 [Nostoc sp. C057]